MPKLNSENSLNQEGTVDHLKYIYKDMEYEYNENIALRLHLNSSKRTHIFTYYFSIHN